jgi:uncharacterized protein YndB with AHSA1/START domain
MAHEEPREQQVELEVVVAGTPEEVWEAIATGRGISAWLHPTEVEEREGGRFAFDMGFGTREGTVTAWDPPRRFGQETTWAPGGDLPAARVATEWLVEARDDGTCLVRMVMSGFGTEAGWDEELEGMAAGMRAALAALASYREHFPGRPAAWVRVAAAVPGDRTRGAPGGAAPPAGERTSAEGERTRAAWAELTGALGLAGAGPGRRFAAGAGAPELAGVVERAGDDAYGRSLLLRLDRPGPGLAELFVLGRAGPLGLQARLYGDDRAERAAHLQPAWEAWLRARFPAPTTPA